MRQLTVLFLILLTLLAPEPETAHAAAPYNQWNGTGPMTAATGDQRIGALLVRSDGILFSGNGNGTVFSYESKAPDATTGGAALLGTSATLNATINANNAATTITFQYGTTTGYGNSATATQSPLAGSTATAVTASISGLTNGTTYHYRVVATSSAGTTYGADQAFTAGQATAVITLGNLAFTYDGASKSTTATTSPSGLAVTITYNGSTTPPTNGGSYTVVATVNDAGYQGSATGTLVIAKTIATVTLTPASLSATCDGTAKAASAITTPAGLTVNLTYSGSPTPPAAAGSYTVVATVNDANYQGSATGTLVIVNSASAPTLTISALADGSITNTATINITGKVTAINGITSVTINGTRVTLATDGSFSLAFTLQPGKNTLTTVATDNADITATDIRTITLDTAAPTITITSPADNSTLAASSVTVTGTVDAGATAQATVNNGSAQSAAMDGTSFSVTLNLSQGTNTISVSAVNLTGNIATIKRTVVSDTTRPTLAIIDPAQDITTSQASLTISGTVSDALTAVSVTITCDGQAYTPQVTDGAFQQQITFTTAKQYAISVTATDLADNSATVQRNVIYAPTQAAFPHSGIIVPADGKTAPDIGDALKALQSIVGLITLSPSELAAADVAPLGADGKPQGDGVVDVGDVVLILRRVVGAVTW